MSIEMEYYLLGEELKRVKKQLSEAQAQNAELLALHTKYGAFVLGKGWHSPEDWNRRGKIIEDLLSWADTTPCTIQDNAEEELTK